MKEISKALVGVVLSGMLFVTACLPVDVPLPDLDPETPEGGEILIFEIFDLIEFSSATPLYEHDLADFETREYDFQGNGNIDLRAVASVDYVPIFNTPQGSYVSLKFAGNLLLDYQPFPMMPDARPYAMFFPVDGLLGNHSTGGWADAGQAVDLFWIKQTTLLGVPWLYTAYPAGVSYLPTKSRISGEDYYGWIEIAASDIGDDDPNEQLFISRFGISQTPGLRIRMGQE